MAALGVVPRTREFPESTRYIKYLPIRGVEVGLGSQTAAGIHVSPESAMKCGVVYSCVKILAEGVGQLPFRLHTQREDGGKQAATDHPLYDLLHDAPNDWTTAYQFRLDMMTALLLHGNAFAFVNRVDGQVVELIQLPSRQVTVETDTRTLEPLYRVTTADGTQSDYSRDQIFHIRTIGTRPNIGDSLIDQCREAIGLAMAMERHASSLFGKGARPSGVFRYPKMLGPEMVKKLKASFNAAHGGPNESGGTVILEDGMDFTPLQFSSVDLQFLEMRRFQIAEISRAFRIPLHLLNDLERTTHNNAEQMGRQFLSFTLLPWLELWEQAVRLQLLTAEERRTYRPEFQTDSLARADMESLYDALTAAVGGPFLAADEARMVVGKGPIAGGADLLKPMNMNGGGGADA